MNKYKLLQKIAWDFFSNLIIHFQEGSIILWRFGGLSQFWVSDCGYIRKNVAVYS